MNDKEIMNRLYGSFGTQARGRVLRDTGLPRKSYYYIREPLSDDTRRILVNVTQKELQTILKHVPGITLKAQFTSEWLQSGMDLNEPRNLPYIYPDYNTSKWEYDLIYKPDDHEKLITIMTMWLSMHHQTYSTINWETTDRFGMTNLCQEILLPNFIT